MNDDEILDLVDGFDNVIGTINRSEYDRMIEEDLGFIRAVDLFIVNDRGEIWTPIRTGEKRVAPNGYDYAAAGHVETGETYVQTLIRETNEELNLEISEQDVEFVAKLKFPRIRYMDCVYLLRTNAAPNFNPKDYSSAEWLTPETLLKNIDNGHPTKRTLASTVSVLGEYLQT